MSVRFFLTDVERDYAAMNTLYATYCSGNRRPGLSTVGVTELTRGGIIEFGMIAVRP